MTDIALPNDIIENINKSTMLEMAKRNKHICDGIHQKFAKLNVSVNVDEVNAIMYNIFNYFFTQTNGNRFRFIFNYIIFRPTNNNVDEVDDVIALNPVKKSKRQQTVLVVDKSAYSKQSYRRRNTAKSRNIIPSHH